VVIASFNHGDLLPAAIDSVLAQDYPALELIVIDDGSTDETPRVLARYRSRARIERRENAGQVSALNLGWSLGRGEILGYLGADDVLAPTAVSRAVECLRQHREAVLAYCDFQLIDAASRPIRRVVTGEFDRDRMVTDLICYPGPGAFFRASAYREAGPWNESIKQNADLEYWLRLSRLGTFVRIPEVLANYRVHERSQSFSKSDAERADEPVRVMQEYFAACDAASPDFPLAPQSLSTAHLLSARLHIRSGRMREGLRHLARAIRTRPLTIMAWRTHRLLAGALLSRTAYKLLWEVERLPDSARSRLPP
jgi:glycosyltransferase involved in cell wall biosynthesis